MRLSIGLVIGLGVFVVSILSSYIIEASSIRTVVLSGQEIPSASSGVLFDGFDDPGNNSKVVFINNAGETTFKGKLQIGSGGVIPATRHGIFQEQAGEGLRTVVRSGDHAPGTPDSNIVFQDSFTPSSPFSYFSVNDTGDIAFRASLAGPGVRGSLGNNIGIWSTGAGSLQIIARTGDKPPGASAETIRFVSMGGPSISREGRTSFSATDLGTRFTTGIWSEDSGILKLVARGGEMAPGTLPAPDYSSPLIHIASSNGLVGFRSVLTSNNGNGPQFDSRWRIEDGAPHLIAYSGSPATEIEVGATLQLDSFDAFSANDAGQFAFTADLFSNGASFSNRVLLLWENNTLSLIARGGTHAPGTQAEATFEAPGPPIINSGGQIAFTGVLKRGAGGVDSGNSQGVWSNGSGVLSLVAREGSQAPDTPADAIFDSIGLAAMNASGQVVLGGVLETGVAGVTRSNRKGIWAQDTSGLLKLIVRAGDDLKVGEDDIRTISELSFQPAIGGVGGFNDSGQIAFIATFVDGSSGVFVSDLVAVPEPTSLLLVATVLIALLSGCRSTRYA